MGTRARGAKGEGVDYKRFLLARLQKGAQRVRGADISTGVALILSIWVCFLLVAVMLDQLFVLPPMVRLVLLMASGASSVVIAYWWIVRPLTSSVNSLYTARTLESAKPDIKNSFVNWMELSKKQDEIPDVIMKTIESRAAQEISKVKVEDAIQPRLVLPALYTMASVVILFCLFTRFTSKDLLSSFQRVLLPLSAYRPPTSTELRITFDPGEKTGTEPATLPAGASMTIKAMRVRGKPDSITAYVRAEGTDYDEPHNLSPTGATNEFVLTLPKRQKTFDLTVVAGDFKSRNYRVMVTAAPMITDWLLTYTPPAYTGEAPFTSTQPDIDGLQGTKVRVEATSNLPVKATGAMIELMDQTIDMSLVDGSEVKLAGELTLTKDGTYRVKFQDVQSRSPEFRPIHHIRVRADQPPRIEFVSPSMPEIEWPADQPLTIHAKVSDDFGIRRSRLVVAKGDDGEEILDVEKGGPGETLGRLVVCKERLTPEVMKGKPGDILEYWIEATDSKLPLSNDASTRADRRRIKLVAPPEPKENNSTQPPAEKEKPTEIAKGESPKEADEPAKGESKASDNGSPEESDLAKKSAKEEPSGSADGKESASSPDDEGGDNKTPATNSKDEAALERLQKYFEKSRDEANSSARPQEAKREENPNTQEQANQEENTSAGEPSGDGSKSKQDSKRDPQEGAGDSDSRNSSENSSASNPQPTQPANNRESAGEKNKPGNPPNQQEASSSDQQDSSSRQQQSGSSTKENEGKSNQPPDGTPSNDGESNSKPPSSNGPEEQQGGSPESKPSTGGKESTGQQDASSQRGESGDKGSSSSGPKGDQESPQQGDGSPKPDGTGSNNAPRSSKQGNDNASASSEGNTDGSASQAESGSPDPKGAGERAAGQDGKPDSVTRTPTSDGSGEPSNSSSSESSKASGEGSSPSKEGQQASGDESKEGSKEGSSGQKESSSNSGPSSSQGNESSEGKGSNEGQSKNSDQPASGGKGSSNPQDAPSEAGDADPKNAGKSSSKEGGNLQQGGEPSDSAGNANDPASPREVNDHLGEKANEADKEKGSNLILRRLEDELRQKKVDPELLKEMGWTEEDAKKFAERMRAESAKGEDPSDPLNQATRAGFGQGTDLRKSTSRSAGQGADQLQDLFSGRRTPPPPEVRKRYEAYMKSLSAEGVAPSSSSTSSVAPSAEPALPKSP